jgi:uncharacterized protein (TIGR00251 family)
VSADPSSAVSLSIRAVPNASRDACAGLMDDGVTWKIRLAAPAVDGRANEALIVFLSKTLGVPRGKIELASGTSSRSKRLRIEGIDRETVSERLASVSGK